MTRSIRLTAENVTYAYGGTLAVRNVTLSIHPGNVHALVGPSGAGKSTLLWLLAGLIAPDTGRIEHITTNDHAPGASENATNARLGMVFQPPMLWEHLNVRAHLDLPLRGTRASRHTRRERIEQVLTRTGLAALADRRAHTLSGGQRQRLALARAVVARPRWLLLDEPMAHLDGPARADLFELLRDLLHETGAGVVLATHHAQEAMRLADEVSIMINGVIAQHGPPMDLYNRPVNLAAARALGPAFELHGRHVGDRLLDGDIPLLSNLPQPSTPQHTTRILRPTHIQFDSAADAPAEIERCEPTGSTFLLTIRIADQRATVVHDVALPTGTRGILRYRPRW